MDSIPDLEKQVMIVRSLQPICALVVIDDYVGYQKWGWRREDFRINASYVKPIEFLRLTNDFNLTMS
jgi:hypothetical protein